VTTSPSPNTLSDKDFNVRREAVSKSSTNAPIVDLAGKGVFDSVSSNRSKQNDQNS